MTQEASGRRPVRRASALDVRLRKGTGPFAMVTAYDAAFARICERAGIDVILVGDSYGMVSLGYSSTQQVDLADMVRAAAAVARGTSRAHIVADLPFMSYEVSDEDAVRSAGELVKYGGAGAVKLEGGATVASRIAAIVRAGIPVMAHIGVLPQTAALDQGFARRRELEQLRRDALAVQEAGAYAVVLEMVFAEGSATLTRELSIPTIGIGSGISCDGQVLVLHDVLGLYPDPPPFARVFADLGAAATSALTHYREDVEEGRFP